jgi:hypothetical protein
VASKRSRRTNVHVVHRPIREIVIIDYTFFADPQKLASAISIAVVPGQPVAFSWAEGVLFLAAPLLGESQELIRDFLRGRMYWSSVAFAPMASFQSTVRVPGSAIDLPVIDMSSKPAVRQAAMWLKQHAPGALGVPSAPPPGTG